jgi:DeoR/GlpR family transcriptional regulator of sugar metabolism
VCKSLFNIEREQEIIDLIKHKKSITVAELSNKFYISEASIRRDLTRLEKKGIIKRTYGGAVLVEGLDAEIPLSVRETEQKTAKDVIGRLAASLVKDGDTAILDSSSTTLRMVPYLEGKDNLTVITNGAKTAVELGEFLHIKVYSTGGALRENSLSYIGELARKAIESFFVETLFFSCRSISLEKGLFDSNEQESELRRIMMNQASRIVLLCDSSKFDKLSFSKISGFERIHYLITDIKPSKEWIDFLSGNKVTLLHG